MEQGRQEGRQEGVASERTRRDASVERRRDSQYQANVRRQAQPDETVEDRSFPRPPPRSRSRDQYYPQPAQYAQAPSGAYEQPRNPPRNGGVDPRSLPYEPYTPQRLDNSQDHYPRAVLRPMDPNRMPRPYPAGRGRGGMRSDYRQQPLGRSANFAQAVATQPLGAPPEHIQPVQPASAPRRGGQTRFVGAEVTFIDNQPPDLAAAPYDQGYIPETDPGGPADDQYFSEDPGVFSENEY